MIIGISGYMGSGKDTVADMIRFLIYNKKRTDTGFGPLTTDYTQYESRRLDSTGWEIKKFAFKLKQMVSLMTGFSVQDLELQSVKDSFLGPEWNSIKPIYGFMGEMDKDIGTPMTIRELLQKFGTDAVRNQVHPNAWVNSLMVDYKPTGEFNHIHDATIYPNWVISDCRFPNEAEAVKDKNGLMIRVERKWKDITLGNGIKGKIIDYVPGFDVPKHSSETSLDTWPFNFVIHNDGTLEELLEIVKEYLIINKII